MGLKYGILHQIVHLVSVFAIGYILDLNLFGYLLVFIIMFAIDADHLPLIRKHGFVGTFKLRAVKEFGKPRRYPVHHILLIVISGLLSSAFLYYNFLFLGVVFTAMFVHMLWDLFEDVVVFRIGAKHWL